MKMIIYFIRNALLGREWREAMLRSGHDGVLYICCSLICCLQTVQVYFYWNFLKGIISK